MATQAEADFSKGCMLQLQAAMVLQWLYCGHVRWQLGAKELKAKKGKNAGKLLGDGLPHLLTDNEFFEKVNGHWEAVEAVEKVRETRKEQKQTWVAKVE